MSQRSLEDVLKTAGNPVDMLRNSQIGPYAFPVVKPEFTNWRDEQKAWQTTVALMDQSHHMTDLYVEGPDAVRLFSDFGVNSFKTFKAGQAKQFLAVNHQGYVIGDAILFFLSEHRLNLVGRPPAHNWVQFNAEKGKYDVKVERDERTFANAGQRKVYRFEVQGPNAVKLMTKLLGSAPPEIGFFKLGQFRIASRDVGVLRHGMVGQPGWELFGPLEQGEEVRAAIVEAGKEFGLRQVGSMAYPTTGIESGWIPSPFPAVYTSPEMKEYRQWLKDTSYEAMASLGGSYVGKVEDYYLTPWDLGYGHMVKFDHDFYGRAALEAMTDKQHRKKVTLVWNGDDTTKVFASMFRDGQNAKHIQLPLANYATLPFDKVTSRGQWVGFSTYTGYTYNYKTVVSLGSIDVAHAEPGSEVTITWGEEGGGTTKPTVERHVQTEIRATVQPAPLSEAARNQYRPAVKV
jgi:glycine cleavage system aminomethyltransferase T